MMEMTVRTDTISSAMAILHGFLPVTERVLNSYQ